MQSIASELDRAFRVAIRDAFAVDADPLISVAQNDRFGDYQSNAAMGLAKKTNTNPRAVAEQIKSRLHLGSIASEVTIAGPGFINVRLNPGWLAERLRSISADTRLGVEPTPSPATVVVEYSSPNIAKEMHIGHIRSTILGDAAARVLGFLGHTVIRQNHIGDWGTQFGKVILSIWHTCMAEHRGEPDWPNRINAALIDAKKQNDAARRAQLVAEVAQRHQSSLDEDSEGEAIFLPYLRERFKPSLARIEPVYQLVSSVEQTPESQTHFISHPRHGRTKLSDQSKLITSFLQKGNEQEQIAWEKVRTVTLEACQRIYARLGVQLTLEDVRGESFYDPDLSDVVAELRRLGIAEESEGAIVVFTDGRDKPPLIIEKSGGHGYLYGTTDLAAIRFRTRFLKADRVFYFVDARQTQHLRQVFETARRAGWSDGVCYEHASFGSILGPDGKPMKTREGDNVKLADVLDEAESRARRIVMEKNPDLPPAQRDAIARAVGIGAIKYYDLARDRVGDYVFDWEKMLALDGNTAPYLQYAYARIRSIFRKAHSTSSGQAGESAKHGTVALKLDSPHELALAKHILRLGEIIELVSRELKPHHLCTYLYELATRFSGFYENCPVLQSEEPIRSSRLELADLTAGTLALGLELLGIEHPEQM